MHRWRYPSLSLHGIEGAFAEAGAKTVIPRKVIGKFSIRLVPDMDPKVVEKQVRLEKKTLKFLLEIIEIYVRRRFATQFLKVQVICSVSSIWDLCICLSNFHVQVKDHLQKTFDEMGSPNKMKVSMGHGAKAWVSDFNHPHYMAGRKAMKTGRVSQDSKHCISEITVLLKYIVK